MNRDYGLLWRVLVEHFMQLKCRSQHTHKPSINGENVNNMHQMILLMQKCYKSTTNNPYFCMRLNCEKWKKMKGSIVTIENKKETECAV